MTDEGKSIAHENECLRLALGAIRAMYEQQESRSGPAATICAFIDATLAECRAAAKGGER